MDKPGAMTLGEALGVVRISAAELGEIRRERVAFGAVHPLRSGRASRRGFLARRALPRIDTATDGLSYFAGSQTDFGCDLRQSLNNLCFGEKAGRDQLTERQGAAI